MSVAVGSRQGMEGAIDNAKPNRKTGALPTDTINTVNEHWASDTCGFIEYWASLRGVQLMPSFEYLSAHMHPKFLPSCYIVAIEGERVVTKFMGTELADRWKFDRPLGTDFLGLFAGEVKKKCFGNFQTVVRHPCGYMTKSALMTSTGQEVYSDVVQLPLSDGPERPQRVIGFSVRDTTRRFGGYTVTLYESKGASWLDIGAGVSSQKPFDIKA